MKVTRRRLAAFAATPLLAQTARTQTPPSASPPGVTPPAANPGLSARDANRRNAETMAKFEVPVAIEPAFKFQP